MADELLGEVLKKLDEQQRNPYGEHVQVIGQGNSE